MRQFDNSTWSGDIEDAISHLNQEIEIWCPAEEWSYSDIKYSLIDAMDKYNSENRTNYEIHIVGWSPHIDNWFVIKAFSYLDGKNNNELTHLLKKG